MKNKLNFAKWGMPRLALMLLASLAVLSCSKEPSWDGDGDGRPAGLKIAFKTSDFTQISTRVPNETDITDITVLQYVNGKLVNKKLLENMYFLNAVELEGLSAMPAANLNEDGKLVIDGRENMICFLANVKKTTGREVSLALNSTYTELEKFSLADCDLTQQVPMYGFYYGGIIEGATGQINVTLSRSVAKISFTLGTTNFRVNGAMPVITVKSIELCRVPAKITMLPNVNRPGLPANSLPGLWPAATIPYPASTSEFKDMTVADNMTTGSPTASYVAYVSSNARGSYENIKSNMDKIPGKTSASIADQAVFSYILVDLDFTTSGGVVKNAKYKIYLGGDEKGDMNILSGVQYNISTQLYGANDADTRITVTPLFDPETGLNPGSLKVQKPANSYIIHSGTNYTGFTIPLTMARVGWNHIKSSLNDGTDYLAQYDDLVRSADWEIVTVWKTWNNGKNITGQKATGITLTSNNGENNYFATLTIPSDIPNGNNAVIGLKKKSDGKIYWSWHLWFTDYNPDATTELAKNGQTHQYFSAAFSSLYMGKSMMDRNLGAAVSGVSGAIAVPTTTDAAVALYGMLYQWGRKDPFTSSSAGTNGSYPSVYDAADQKITGTIGNDSFSAEEAGTGSNLINAIQKPMTFYKFAGNWTTPSEDLWSPSTKTPFDPCPAGWRVPAGGNSALQNPWAGFADNNPSSTAAVTDATAGSGVFEWSSATGPTSGRLYNKNGVQAWYPASGYRLCTSGAFGGVDSYGLWWSCRASSATVAFALSVTASIVRPSGSDSHAYSFAVRCVQE